MSSILVGGTSKELDTVSENFSRAARSAAYGRAGLNSIQRFLKDGFEPKIFWREDFLTRREGEDAGYNTCPNPPVRVL